MFEKTKSLALGLMVAGALTLPFSKQAQAQQSPPPAHNGIEEIVEYDPNRGCVVGFMASQSRGNRPQGVRLSDDDVMTQTTGLQCKYFQILTSKNRVEGPGQDSDSYRMQVNPIVVSDDGGFLRVFLGLGATNYEGPDNRIDHFDFGFQFKELSGGFPLNIKFSHNRNWGEEDSRQGDSEYSVATVGHDFDIGGGFKIPVTAGIERYAVTNSGGHRERQNEIFAGASLKYETRKDGAGFAAEITRRNYLNDKPQTKLKATLSHRFK